MKLAIGQEYAEYGNLTEIFSVFVQCILLITFGPLRSENICIKLIEMVVKTVNQLINFDFNSFLHPVIC